MANTKQKSNSVLTMAADVDAGTITWRVAGVAAPIVLEMANVAQANLNYAAYHGLAARCGDKAALPFNRAENRYPTPREKWEAVSAIVAHYNSGTTEWTMKGGGAGSAGSEGSLTLRAAAIVQGADVATMRKRAERAAGKGGVKVRAILAKWAKYPAIRAEMDKLRDAEVGDVDVDALLGELNGGEAETDSAD